MILIDSNVFMYATGRSHEHKEPSVAFLRSVARGDFEAAIDAEALQEVLHRYRSLGRWQDGVTVYDLARHIVPMVVPITDVVMDCARQLLEEHSTLEARDAVHAAVVELHQLDAICSYDRDFDSVPGLHRLEPHEVE